MLLDPSGISVDTLVLNSMTPTRVLFGPILKPLTASTTKLIVSLKFVWPTLPEASRTKIISKPAADVQPTTIYIYMYVYVCVYIYIYIYIVYL